MMAAPVKPAVVYKYLRSPADRAESTAGALLFTPTLYVTARFWTIWYFQTGMKQLSGLLKGADSIRD